MEQRQGELLSAQDTIKKLEDQLRETQVAKEELMSQQNELREMMTRLEDDKKGEVEDIVAEVKRKEDENRQLQEEMDMARQRQEEASQALIAATTTPRHHHLQEMDGASDDEEEDQRIPNGDHSQNLREDDEDLMDPV